MYSLEKKYLDKLEMTRKKRESQRVNLEIVTASFHKTVEEETRLEKSVVLIRELKSEMDSLRGFLGAEDSMARYQKLNYMRDSERTEEESVELAEIKRERSRARADISDIESRLRKAELGWKEF